MADPEEARATAKQRKSAGKRSVFPSLTRWEGAWEAAPSLERLRPKRTDFDREFALVAEKHPAEAKPQIPRPDIAKLADVLDLQSQTRKALIDDVQIVADWYFLLERQSALLMGHAHNMQELQLIGELVHDAQQYLALNAHVIEELIATIDPPLSEPIQNLDLQRLSDDLYHLGKATSLIRERLVKPGAIGHARRDHAMAMLTQAVEAATDRCVTFSRGNKDNPNPHFTNEEGWFVSAMMRLLDWPNEAVLARAFERMQWPLKPAQR